MLDARQAQETLTESDAALRCEALIDRVSALPVGHNPHALRVILAECAALERAAANPSAVCKLRDARHWLRLAYGHELHAYPMADLRRLMLAALDDVRRASI
jgi:endonuclease/exonuclease/phosphatase (EEP) superfamily protein YafD